MKKILLVIAAIIIVGVLQQVQSPSKNNSANTTPNHQTNDQKDLEQAVFSNKLLVEYGPENREDYGFYESKEQFNAFSLLQKVASDQKFTLETQQYDFGIFVKSINGYESTAEKAWIYFVNGESGSVAADQYKLIKGDVVEWRHVEPSDSE